MKIKRPEELIGDFIVNIVHLGLTKIIKEDLSISYVRALNESMIIRFKEKENIEGIIIDVDETLRKDMKDIPKCNKQWLDMVGKHLKICILSNGKDGDLEEYFKEKEIDYITLAFKPLKRNFVKACEKMGVEPNKVMVLGDSIFDDIHGGNKNNMKTVLVKYVEDDER